MGHGSRKGYKTTSLEREEETMSVFKRGSVYWFDFVRNGVRYQQSTKVRNRRDAEAIEDAYKTNLARGEVRIEEKEVKQIPTLEQFGETFMQWVRAEKVNTNTHAFYE